MDASYTWPIGRPRARRPRRLALLAAVLAAALLGGAAPAPAFTPPAPTSDGRFTVVRDGYGPQSQPRFAVRVTSFAATGEIRWRICAPDCGDVVGSGQQFAPDALPVGATVLASTAIGGEEFVARSPAWPGPPVSATLPGINGDLRIGRAISPARGTWSGGWADDFSTFEYRLCRTAGGEDCRPVHPGDATDHLVIDPAWAGWFLGTIEHRYTHATVFTLALRLPPPWGVLPVGVVPAAAERTAIGSLAGPIPAARPGTPPRVRGTLAAGRTVRPKGGTWPDAPDLGAVWTGLRACPTRTADERCVPLTDFARIPGSPAIPGRRTLPALDQAVRIAPRHLGWYVGAVDLRIRNAADRGMAIPPLQSLADLTIPAPSPVVVHGPLSRTPVRLGFTPRAAIRARAATHATRRTTLATVRCRSRCVARVTVASGGRTTRSRLAVRGSKRLTVPARATRGDRARVTIRFDHHPRTVRRTVRLR